MSTSINKTSFHFLIWLPTGMRNAGAAVDWGLRRLRTGYPSAKRHFVTKSYSIRKQRHANYFSTKVSLVITSLNYKFIANNCIEVHIRTNRPINFNQLRNIIRAEIKGPYIRAITEETPMVMF